MQVFIIVLFIKTCKQMFIVVLLIKTCMGMFKVVLFIITKKWKQSKYLSVGKWIKQNMAHPYNGRPIQQ